MPRDWDLPLPEPCDAMELTYKPLQEEDLDAIREEGSSRSLPTVTVRLLLEMLKVVNNPGPSPADVDGLVRRFATFFWLKVSWVQCST